LELLQRHVDKQAFLFDDPFLPKPATALPSTNLQREFKLVGVVLLPRMPVGFQRGDVIVDLSRCSIDFIGAITPAVLNMDNPNGAYELDLSNARDRCHFFPPQNPMLFNRFAAHLRPYNPIS
jgi:hypothetical protein